MAARSSRQRRILIEADKTSPTASALLRIAAFIEEGEVRAWRRNVLVVDHSRVVGVNDSNAEIAVPVKSVSELETAYSRARMELGKPEYLRMDNQQNLVSNDPSTLTAFEAKRLAEGTKIKRSAPGHQSQDGLAEVVGRFTYEASTAQLAVRLVTAN